MTYLVSLVATIDQRLDEIAEEIAQLESARTSLERAQLNGASHRNGTTAGTRAPRRRSAPLSREELVRILGEAEDGLSASTIAEQTGFGYQATLSLLRELEATGTVRRVGSRRSTRWRVLTDEDWIAERAAELERLAGSRS
jgi:predicted Rossmann fold nucleotide-binding protein DprA/Smf involved in DNA uptake